MTKNHERCPACGETDVVLDLEEAEGRMTCGACGNVLRLFRRAGTDPLPFPKGERFLVLLPLPEQA